MMRRKRLQPVRLRNDEKVASISAVRAMVKESLNQNSDTNDLGTGIFVIKRTMKRKHHELSESWISFGGEASERYALATRQAS